MCDNLDLKNYVDVMKLDACCKRRDTFKLVGIEVKESSAATPSSCSLPPSTSSSSCTSKKHVSIASHGSRSLDHRNSKTEVKTVKGILRSRERETEENSAGARKEVGPPGKENERVVDDYERERFPDGSILESFGRRSSASIAGKGAQTGMENATCSAHGMKVVSGLQSDPRGGIWGSVKSVKVSPPRMKRRKKKTNQVASSTVATIVPRTETRQSRLAALLSNRIPSRDAESEGPVLRRRRSPPRPNTVCCVDTSGPTTRTAVDTTSPPVFESRKKEDGRLGLTLTGPSEVGQVEFAAHSEVKDDEEGLGFRVHPSAVQSSPDFTSDDTDGGGKDSGYVTMEELQAQLLARSSSSGDEKEIESSPSSSVDRQGQDPLIHHHTSGEGTATQKTEIDRSPQYKDTSLLQFTFTVKLDSSLVRRRQLSLASRALTTEDLKTGDGLPPPVIAGKVDVVVSELTKTADQTELAAIGGIVQKSGEGEDVVDGCLVPRDSSVGRSTVDRRTSKQSLDLSRSQRERTSAGTLSSTAETKEPKRTKKISDDSSDEVTNWMEGSIQSYPGRQEVQTGFKTGRGGKAAQKKEPDKEEISSAVQSKPEVTPPWDLGTYLRPVGTRSGDDDDARVTDATVGTRSEAIHMSWQEVVAEAHRLGIPLDIPRQRRGRTVRHGWTEQRRSCDSSAESDGSLEEEEEEEEEDEDDDGDGGGRGRGGERKTGSHRKTGSGTGSNRFGQSGDQGAVLLKTRRTLKELLKMRNPFFGRSKKKKSRKGGQQKGHQRGDGACCCCDDSPPSGNRRRRNPPTADEHVTMPCRSSQERHHTTSGTTCNGLQKSATCCRSSAPQPCDKLAPRRPQCFDDAVGLSDADGRDEVDMGPTTPVNCDGGMMTKYKDTTNEVALSPVSNYPVSSNRKADFVRSLSELQSCGWYWGQMELEEAEMKLANKPDGTFLVRDSSDDRYILSLSFRSLNGTHHTRIEHYKGMFGFHSQMQLQGVATIVDFINKAMEVSKDGRCVYYLRPRGPGLSPAPVQLLHPLSRFKCLHSLKHLCKFIIMRRVRLDLIDRLPISPRLKEYLKGSPDTQ